MNYGHMLLVCLEPYILRHHSYGFSLQHITGNYCEYALFDCPMDNLKCTSINFEV